jgi:superfamily I DNA/RNA helicase
MACEITSGDILTSEQLKTHIRVFAGPGAGKTHFLVENIKNIVTEQKSVSQSRLRKVLCVTYTNAAVDEIKERLNRFSDSVEIFTIHSFIIEHIIKPFQSDLRSIISEEFGIDTNSRKPITSQIEGLGILHGIDKEDIYKFVNDITSENAVLTYSKKVMGDVQINIADFAEHHNDKEFKVKLSVGKIPLNEAKAIKEYIWSVARKLTHDEILYFGYRILKHNSTALYALRVKFPFVFVDEFQDTNPVQAMILKLIGEESTVVGVIGDVAQSIYSFQGAKPSHFNSLSFGNKTIDDYMIKGNRRSAENIVNFCNYLRQSDTGFSQKTIRKQTQNIPVRFLIGNSNSVKEHIESVINNNGVVITRAWAKAFSYISGIADDQIDILKKIHNNYRNTPIDIRAEIVEMNNVTWVRAFKFIFAFYEAFNSGSFIDAVKAFNFYSPIERKRLNIGLFKQMNLLASETFSDITEQTTTVAIIEKMVALLSDEKVNVLLSSLLNGDFNITVFDEYDLTNNQDFVATLKKLNWKTSYKLFTEVFSKSSRYMTVHQAKGLEWDSVLVSVEPNRFDKITLADVYTNPKILSETAADEFVRMYYVACSRAREQLYIHLPDNFKIDFIRTALSKADVVFEIIS